MRKVFKGDRDKSATSRLGWNWVKTERDSWLEAILPQVFDDPIYEMTGVDQVSLGDAILLARQGTPEEVAYAILFLASNEASYITGYNLAIDGGVTAQ